jgi:hypothetical protein
LRGYGGYGRSCLSTCCFIYYFIDSLDRRQAEKVLYPLPEIPLLWLLIVLAGSEALNHLTRFGKKSWACCADFYRSRMKHRLTMTSVTLWQLWLERIPIIRVHGLRR